MFFKQQVLFLLFAITFQIDYKAETQKRCTADIKAQLESDGKDRADLRAKYEVKIGMNVDDFEKVMDGNASGILKGGPVAFVIFGIILFIFAIILFIIFLANLCCCKKADTS